jgi:rhodanese-related sulfurtransferase
MSANVLTRGFKQLVADANSVVETIPAAEAVQRLNDEGVVFIDLRDLPELQRDGKIPGAVHVSRGMLEFVADPESPYHNPVFNSGKSLLLYCASGGRSALAAQRLQEMGFASVTHIGGGIKAWKVANGPVEPVE